MTVKNYKPRICTICNLEYVPISPMQKFCKNCAPSGTDSKAYSAFYRKNFPDKVREYERKWMKEKYRRNRENILKRRRERRKEIQDKWGRVEGKKGTWLNDSWIKSEEYAMKALEKEGYTNIIHLSSYFPCFPFDLKADKNGEMNLFQVTMKIHASSDILRHKRLAQDMHGKYGCVFIKPDFSGYLIRHYSLEINKKLLDEVKSL